MLVSGSVIFFKSFSDNLNVLEKRFATKSGNTCQTPIETSLSSSISRCVILKFLVAYNPYFSGMEKFKFGGNVTGKGN